MGYGLIGERLGHSFSPRIHAMLGDYDYALYPLAQEELPDFMRQNHLRGFNVTIPYKQAVLPYMQALSPAALAIGAVNTVIRQPDGSYLGDNTDYTGFLSLLDDRARWWGRKALVLGSGGSSRTVRAVLSDLGAEPIVIISRTGEDNYGNIARHRDARLIVNTTPLGMYPNLDQSPLSLTAFDSLELVIDLIYNPARTRLLLEAEDLGIPCRNGLKMLVRQAERAGQLWGLVAPDQDCSDALTERLEKESLNIALIGMPGCGKTAVGEALARLSGRPLWDVDEMIEQRAGLPIPQIFAAQGEAAFRALETACLRDAARESGIILAAGGGIVTVPRNRELLRQNSRVLWLERELALLPLSGRPLSQGRGVEALYAERAPLYRAWSEASYRNEDVDETARRIREDWL